MFVVAVEFHIAPEHWEAFLPLMMANARRSLSVEAECHQFDVCTDPDSPHQVFLYETYTDKAAFQAHLDSPHFKEFDRTTAPMVASKSARTFREVAQ
ncbi:putative quinol monooxygenase [Algirhabdus cladophorae]|uniref:putative quinol monooxygenase n=1 Tax=Algirhabdus cladophorae TaxID=3377108 RepID=UPI003B8468C1